MSQTNEQSSHPAPFLTAYASERTGGPAIDGFYDYQASMWITNAYGEPKPLIHFDSASAELVTKRMVQQESDDDDVKRQLLELATKTGARLEQDDVSDSFILELATKTEAQAEHDDTSPKVTSMFL